MVHGISDDGVDLKFLILVIREIYANLQQNGNFFFSDPISLTIPFVNNNDFRVWWVSQFLDTKQAEYGLNNIPINSYTLAVRPVLGDNVTNDSTCFIVQYI
jgi:hypothetical protein